MPLLPLPLFLLFLLFLLASTPMGVDSRPAREGGLPESLIRLSELTQYMKHDPVDDKAPPWIVVDRSSSRTGALKRRRQSLPSAEPDVLRQKHASHESIRRPPRERHVQCGGASSQWTCGQRKTHLARILLRGRLRDRMRARHASHL